MPFEPILALHIPDGFLSVPVALSGWIVIAFLVRYALNQTQQQFGERQIALMGVLAAFIFAAQMINFPVAGGTSGHLLGGMLVAVLLGPWAAVPVMTSVITVQALLFQDGGLLAMGYNIFNMGIVTVFVGYVAYSQINRHLGNTGRSQMIGAAVGAWLGVEFAAIATALQLAVSGTSPLDVALPAMVGVHALIGIGEGLITVGALAFIRQTRPDLVSGSVYPSQGSGWVTAGLVIALLVVLISPLASSDPDGLERVAEDSGFAEQAAEPVYETMPDYSVPFIENETASTILAGAIGLLTVAAVGIGTTRLGRRRIAANKLDTTSYAS